MGEKKITVTLEKAKEWHNSDNATLKEIALQAFSEKELNVFDFTKIKTFKDALLCLYPFDSKGYRDVIRNLAEIKTVSKASAAVYKLNIIRRALNKGYNMHLTKDADGQDYVWYPYFRFITKDCTYYDPELKDGTLKKIGKIINEGVTYEVLYGSASNGSNAGFGLFNFNNGVGVVIADLGFFGCATKEIAEYFGEHFGTLIMEAMYGDMVDLVLEKKEI